MIRKAKPEDLPELLALYDHLRGGLAWTKRKPAAPTKIHAKGLAAMMKLPGCHLLVSVEHGKVTGTCTLYILPRVYPTGQPWAVLDTVVVAEDHQGQGQGSRLIRHAIKMAKQAGCYQVNLTSNTQRTRAHRFYESLGFEGTYIGFKYVF
jgi:GNAT superfamily N-acetyltransferase